MSIAQSLKKIGLITFEASVRTLLLLKKLNFPLRARNYSLFIFLDLSLKLSYYYHITPTNGKRFSYIFVSTLL